MPKRLTKENSFKQDGGNLQKWEPGEQPEGSGKPKGRRNNKTIIREILSVNTENLSILNSPKSAKKKLQSLLGDKLANECIKVFGHMSLGQLMHLVQIRKAIQTGDTQAYNAVLDRVDGKPKQINENINPDMTYEQYLASLKDD